MKTATNLNPKRVLFVGEAVTLAHIGRLIPLATRLHEQGHHVLFAANSGFEGIVGALPFPRASLYSVSSKEFLRILRRAKFPYSLETLERYVADDLALMREFRPDVVVGDFRLSLMASARLANVPYIQIVNAYWSPDFALDYPVPENPIVDAIGPRWGQMIWDIVRPMALRDFAKTLRRLSEKFDVSSSARDIRDFYLEADYVLFSDTPEMVPLQRKIPDHLRFSGPIHWSPTLTLPSWWQTRPQDAPWVCVSLGSSGDYRVLPTLLRTLAKLPVYTLLIGEEPAGLAKSARRFSSSSIPNLEAFEGASLVIGNGGSPAAYMALSKGVPYLGIATNLDQFLMMSCVRHAGVGDFVRASSVDGSVLKEKIEHLMSNVDVKKNILRHKSYCEALDPLRVFEDLISEIAGSSAIRRAL